MIINHNMSAINSSKDLKFRHWEIQKNMEKLSSGMRINRAGDDAAGLAVSEHMRTQIQGLRQAERNTEDGISFVQTTEGYLSQSASIIQRMRVLAVQSANGIYSPEDRKLIQVEVDSLLDEIDRIANDSEFNQMTLLNGAFAKAPAAGATGQAGTAGPISFHIGPNKDQVMKVSVESMTADALKLKVAAGGAKNVDLTDVSKANSSIEFLDKALQQIGATRADLGAAYNRMEHTAKGLMNAYENMQASESRIRDVDMAEEMVDFSKNQVLVQTNSAMLAQANIQGQSVLRLLVS